MGPAPRDFVIRIALTLASSVNDRRGDSHCELNPSVWRRFRCSSHLPLDVLHDKVIAPIMGWCRNYHLYMFVTTKGDSAYMVNSSCNTNSNELQCILSGNFRAYQCLGSPRDSTLGDLVSKVGDKAHYIYDLRDHWKHVIELEEVLVGPADAHGKCLILDGAMHCPPEDLHGCRAYQEHILKDYLALLEDPHDAELARTHASKCFGNPRRALNVMGPFRPAEFSLKERQEELYKAFRSKSSVLKGTKRFTYTPRRAAIDQVTPGPGQRRLRTKYEDDRLGVYKTAQEIINIKPDDNREAVCVCGNPLELEYCSGCKSVQYCSRECQREDWRPHHKQQCPIEKANRAKSVKVEAREVGRPIPGDMNREGPTVHYTKWREPLRFTVGTKVECSFTTSSGQQAYAEGKIVQSPYRHSDGTIKPYQMLIDLRTSSLPEPCLPDTEMIYAIWDDDVQLRKLPPRR